MIDRRLPPYYRTLVRRFVPGGDHLGDAFNTSIQCDAITFKLILFSSPNAPLGLLADDVTQQHPNQADPLKQFFFYGYLCDHCQKVIFVRDSYADLPDLDPQLQHACTNPGHLFDLREFEMLLASKHPINPELAYELHKLIDRAKGGSSL